jgi:regulator of sigma E protease
LEHQDGMNPPSPEPPGSEPMNRASVGDLITVLIVAAAFASVLRYLDFLSFLKVLMGLSFVIFIHELGHFLVAKWCDVNVSHFSIGFGPVIPGCSFQWGETKYQICLLPLGGYVQMLGQVDGDETSDGSENDPRSYRNKTVGQRMAIISAGVIMNAILAVICFIVVYRGPGKDRLAAVVDATDPGSPAFVDGLRTGMKISQIGDTQDPYFDDLKELVVHSYAGEKIRLVAAKAGDPKPLELTLEPRKTKDDANPVIGVRPAPSTRLPGKREVGATAKGPVDSLSPAAEATPPFDFNDVIVGASDPKDPAAVTPLADDPYKKDQKDYFDLLRRFQLLAGKDMLVRVERESGSMADIKVPPAYRTSIGAIMQMGHITAIRKNSPADAAKLQLPGAGQIGDLIEKVEVVDDDGKTLTFENATLDPERLPAQLKLWAQRLVEAGQIEPAPTVKLVLRRHRQQGGGPQFESITVELPWDNGWQFDRAIPISVVSPLAIPELGLAYQVKTTIAHVTNASGPLKPGDVIKNFRVTYKDSEGTDKTTSWQAKKEIGPDDWAHIGVFQLQTGLKYEKVHLKVERNKEVQEIDIEPSFDKTWPLVMRGIGLLEDVRKQKADTTLEAIGLGFRDTFRTMRNVLNGIRQMIMGRISWEKHLGGPISIASIAYRVAGLDFWEFVFFLGMISVNLAVINFLPIPLLDGGHMVFLTYEKLRGKPASESVRIAATYVGLAFIACLILLVSWLDIGRLL